MDNPTPFIGADVEHKALDPGVPAWAIKPGPTEVPEIPLVPGSTVNKEDFEGTLWLELNLVSSSGWFVTSLDAHAGTKSLESADVAGPVVSDLVINDFSFSEQLSFWIKAHLVESAGDKFEVLFDGTPVYTLTEPVTDWTRIAIPTNFAFNIQFRFTQNFPFTSPFVRLDDIIFGSFDTPGVPGAPAHPFVYTPLKMTDDGERLKVSDETVETAVNQINATAQIIQNLLLTGVTGTLNNGIQVSTSDASAVSILAANTNRKSVIIQNVGNFACRIGVSGVTATTGIQLQAGDSLVMTMPFVPDEEFFMVREGAVNTTVFVTEVTA